MHEHEARINKLEEQHADKMVRIGVLDEQWREMDRKLDSLTKKLEEIHTVILQWRSCPSPGLCLQLNEEIKTERRQLEDLKKTVAGLEQDRDMVTKGWRGVLSISGGVLLLGTLCYWTYWIVEYFIHKSKP